MGRKALPSQSIRESTREGLQKMTITHHTFRHKPVATRQRTNMQVMDSFYGDHG
jgi:hypothetical protein